MLTRQSVPHQRRDESPLAAIRRGGYVLRDADREPELILIATGSEVALAVGAAAVLCGEGFAVRVVSMPCTELFAAQDAAWRDAVLPPALGARIVVEAGSPDAWWRYAGSSGRVIGMPTFGRSAPAGELFAHYGFSVDNIAGQARELLAGARQS